MLASPVVVVTARVVVTAWAVVAVDVVVTATVVVSAGVAISTCDVVDVAAQAPISIVAATTKPTTAFTRQRQPRERSIATKGFGSGRPGGTDDACQDVTTMAVARPRISTTEPTFAPAMWRR